MEYHNNEPQEQTNTPKRERLLVTTVQIPLAMKVWLVQNEMKLGPLVRSIPARLQEITLLREENASIIQGSKAKDKLIMSLTAENTELRDRVDRLKFRLSETTRNTQ